MKKFFILFFLFSFSLYDICYSQVYSGYIIKSLKNLFIVDIGKLNGIETDIYFIVYHHKKGKGYSKTKKDFEYFGIAEITQIFDDVSVLKFVSLKTTAPLKEGYYISLIQTKKIPEEETYSFPSPKIKEPESKTIATKDILIRKENLKNSVYIGLIGGFDNFPLAVSEKIENYLKTEIYNYNNQDVSSIKKSIFYRGGITFSAERKMNNFLSIRGNYGNIRYNRYLSSMIREDLDPSIILPDEYVKKWQYKIRTNINHLSGDVLIGNFGNIINFIEGFFNYKRFIYYGGFGLDYASFDYDTDETITIHRNNRDDIVNDAIHYSLSGYWGYHGVIGISYFFSALRIYGEYGYSSWNKKFLEKNYPFRAGISFHF